MTKHTQHTTERDTNNTDWIYTTGMPGGYHTTRHDAIGDLAIQLREDPFSNPFFAATIVTAQSSEQYRNTDTDDDLISHDRQQPN